MKPLTLILLLSIMILPFLLTAACGPTRVHYGVSVHAGRPWGYHHHRYYHHRPSYKPHYHHHRRR